MSTTIDFDRVLGETRMNVGAGGHAYRTAAEVDGSPSAEEREAVYAIATLMACANGSASRDEIDTLVALRSHFEGESPRHARDVQIMLGRFESLSPRDRSDALDEVAGALRRPFTRALAYKAAMALALGDLETNPAEEATAKAIVAALSLRDLAPALLDEVHAGLTRR